MPDKPVPGSVSHGTLQLDDIFGAVERLLPKKLVQEYKSARYQDFVMSGWNPVHAKTFEEYEQEAQVVDLSRNSVMYEIIWDYLNSVAPEGYYFGSHPGDGSDIGFWPVEEM